MGYNKVDGYSYCIELQFYNNETIVFINENLIAQLFISQKAR
jgi:hypothetical protein